jgi:hypothetical protein
MSNISFKTLRLPLLTKIFSNKEFNVVLGLIIFAAIFRMPTLGSPLIEDEAISFNRYIEVPWQKLVFGFHDTNQHTLYLLISKLFIWVFGETEIAYRLPSFIFGVLSIPLMCRLGLAMKFPWSSALLSSILMALSWPHLKYSMEGRGYGVTIFLVLLIIYSSIQFLNNSRWVWGGVLSGSGIAMIMALPSNLFFLFALPVFVFLERCFVAEGKDFPIKKLISFFLPLLIMFTVIGIYFLIIYEELKYGKDIQPLILNEERMMELAELLVAPWGLGGYIFFAVGAWRLKGKRERNIFISIFFVPIVITLVTGVVGYARIYLYWLPFILFLSAYGMVEVISWIKKMIGNIVYGVGAGVVFLLVFFPAKQMAQYYEARDNGSLVVAGPNATLLEAVTMAAWAEENISENNLIIISTGGPESSALVRYMKKIILERMIYFSRGGELKKVVFISHQAKPPWNYPFVPMVQERMLKLPSGIFNKIHSIGNLSVYELNLKIERLIPSGFDPDYEIKVGNSNIPKVNISHTESPKALGEKALYIENNSGKPMDIISPIVKGVDITEDHAYLLYSYITDFQPLKNVYAHLAEKKNWPPELGYLNPLLGTFRVTGENNFWDISYSLSALTKGRHFFQERIGIKIGDNYYDGLQSYLLTG